MDYGRPTLEQWNEWKLLADVTKRAHQKLETSIMLAIPTMDEDVGLALMDLLKTQCSASFGYASYMLGPQDEYMGGDPLDGANYKTREPNVVPLPRQYLKGGS